MLGGTEVKALKKFADERGFFYGHNEKRLGKHIPWGSCSEKLFNKLSWNGECGRR